MPNIFDHSHDQAIPLQELEVHFRSPEAGWVHIRIIPLHELYAIHCSYIWDPLPDMIAWLEQIAGGDTDAVWFVDQEGDASRLQFYAARDRTDGPGDFLLHIQTDDHGITRIRGVRVDRRQLVEAFYRAFRAMTEHADYRPREWEMHPDFATLDDLDDEAYCREHSRFPYGGANLRDLKSTLLEAYLAGANES